ncbi:hypothetical protein SAMN05421857_0109 [Chryseobacterium formosense]|uniref:hypothetical protein n=1 Tax=Chryseobacterium formosense TaxID=236814 RepID=UPI0008E14294|nr:hypothetical protein [Chryseobacterium formosense]SFT33512.1 hypothetical protein SAMN05421857_0109 [Chryseobacterium formosense]
MRKTIAIILIILTFILGYLSIGIISFFGMRSYYGYDGYCSDTKLSNFVAIESFEILIICTLISYAILLEFFQNIIKNVKFYKVIIVFLLINLIFFVYKIVEYPIIMEATGGWSNPRSNLEMMYNPLITFLGIYSSIIIWINFRLQKKTQSLKKIPIIFFLFVILAFIVIAIATQSIEYKDCRG